MISMFDNKSFFSDDISCVSKGGSRMGGNTIQCPKCGNENDTSAAECDKCGVTLSLVLKKAIRDNAIAPAPVQEAGSPNPAVCPKCGHDVRPSAAECIKCGIIFSKWNSSYNSVCLSLF